MTKSALLCPCCKHPLGGSGSFAECDLCQGAWLESRLFWRICEDHELEASLLPGASMSVSPYRENARGFGGSAPATPSRPTYIPCLECGKLMNQVDFARCSGVVIDLCNEHGVWFDRDEIARVVEFLRQGGLERARQKLGTHHVAGLGDSEIQGLSAGALLRVLMSGF
jgi:Zn-finger nucleic acid-binding protein